MPITGKRLFGSVMSFVMLFAVATMGVSTPAAASGNQTFTVVLPGNAVSDAALAVIQKAGGVVVDRVDEIGT